MLSLSLSQSIWYRYFFYDWLFKNCAVGNRFELYSAWRHNKENAKWLPRYMKRWMIFGLIFFGLAAFIESQLLLPVLSAFFYIPSVLTIPYNTVTLVSWIGLKILPNPL